AYMFCRACDHVRAHVAPVQVEMALFSQVAEMAPVPAPEVEYAHCRRASEVFGEPGLLLDVSVLCRTAALELVDPFAAAVAPPPFDVRAIGNRIAQSNRGIWRSLVILRVPHLL